MNGALRHGAVVLLFIAAWPVRRWFGSRYGRGCILLGIIPTRYVATILLGVVYSISTGYIAAIYTRDSVVQYKLGAVYTIY